MLNAFRHQRGLRSPKRRRLPPLDACAQRLSASKRDSPYDEGFAHSNCSGCSTPFGIKEGFTRSSQSVACAATLLVLNAFRHQRGIHFSAGDGRADCRGCSTPFGIKEGFTHTPVDPWAPHPTCSTPFGIKEGFTCKVSRGKSFLTGAQRLSASKRDSPCSVRLRWPCWRGAQRLSASKRDSHPLQSRQSTFWSSAQRLSASKRDSPPEEPHAQA